MWMCAGFTMLEAGSVRTKNASVICLKNIGLYSIAGLAYFVIGYNLMYTDVGSVIGSFTLFHGSSAEEIALIGGDEAQAGAVAESGYSTMSNWFFQMVFVATAASIVSGTLAERVKLWSFFVFTLFLTGFIYPGGGGLDLGRRVARRVRIPGLRGLYDRSLHGGMGRPGRCPGGRSKARQVSAPTAA